MAAYTRNLHDDGDPNQHVYVLSSHEVLKLERILEEVNNGEIRLLNEVESKWADNFQELFRLGVVPGNYEI